MTDQERKDFIQLLSLKKKQFSKDKKAAKEFFIKAGILTKSGNLSSRYKK
jgi:hypothetical protein